MYLEPAVDIALRADIRLEDGDLDVVVDDGDVGVRFVLGAGGARADAFAGAERLIAVMRQYLDLVRDSHRAG